MAAIAARYARAFAEVAAEHKMDADRCIQELEQLSALFQESHELHNGLFESRRSA